MSLWGGSTQAGETLKTEVSCAGGCGAKTTEPEALGWELLPITGRWRCGACTGELRAADRTRGGTEPPLAP